MITRQRHELAARRPEAGFSLISVLVAIVLVYLFTRDMPLALLLALGVVALLYASIQIVSMAAVPDIAAST